MTDDHEFDFRNQTVEGNQTVINEVDKLFIQSSLQSATTVIPYQIPSPPKDFTGRIDELNELKSQFNYGANITGLRGLGGIGKTVLACKLAEMLQDRYPDGNLLLELQGSSEKPLTVAEAVSQVIRFYLPTAHLPQTEAELVGLYRSVLKGKCVLILLDNAFDDRQVRPLVPPSGCGVIVTSRRKFTISGLIAKDLDTLNLDQSVEFLLKVARTDAPIALLGEEKVWAEIARLCGCLPLALRAAGSFIANTTDLSLAKYAIELQNEHKRLETIGKEGVELDVNSCFELSYRHLNSETARICFCFCFFYFLLQPFRQYLRPSYESYLDAIFVNRMLHIINNRVRLFTYIAEYEVQLSFWSAAYVFQGKRICRKILYAALACPAKHVSGLLKAKFMALPGLFHELFCEAPVAVK